jgi:hypothetical protein
MDNKSGMFHAPTETFLFILLQIKGIFMDVVNDYIVLRFSLGLKFFFPKVGQSFSREGRVFIPFSWVLIGFCTNTHSFQYLCSLLAALHKRLGYCTCVCPQTYLFRRKFANFYFLHTTFQTFQRFAIQYFFTP